jgi:RNA polymerase sigma factor (sigma-70 family)
MSEAAAPRGDAAGRGLARVLSDDRLTKRAVAGDERAFAAIFRRYHQSLYRFCLAIVGNPEDAQDALQNTMAKVLRALPGEERSIELKPWLYRIAHNESIDLLRRRRETRELDAELAAPGTGLAEDVATRERLRQLIADLGELPERQREVLVMRELAGLGFEEIGSALGTSGAGARQTLYEARQSLRQMEEGREMSCEAVTRALSDGDGRVIRRRDVRAHLRTCTGCRRVRDDIKRRQRDFAAISPLPAAVAAGLLHGLGGAHAGGGGGFAALAGGAAKTAGASTALKGVATVAVVAAIGAGAADRSGVIHLGLPGEQRSGPTAGSRAGGAPGTAAGGAAEGSGGASAGAGLGHSKAAAATASSGPSSSGKTSAGVAAARSHAANGTEASPSAPSENRQGHPRGNGHEKQHPAAAEHGQQTAAAHHGGAGGQGASHGSGNPHPVHPSHPAAVPPAPKPEHPASPEPKSAPAAGGGAYETEAATEPEPATAPAAGEEEASGSEEFGSE